MMKFQELRAGYHLTQAELVYATGIVELIRQHGYIGDIKVVGSKAIGSRVGRFEFYNTDGLSREQKNVWFKFLNDEARKHNYCAKDIPKLEEHLPPDAPPEIHYFLQGDYGDPDADLDLLLKKRPDRIKLCYIDGDTGLGIEIHEKGSWRRFLSGIEDLNPEKLVY